MEKATDSQWLVGLLLFPFMAGFLSRGKAVSLGDCDNTAVFNLAAAGAYFRIGTRCLVVCTRVYEF